MKSNSAAIAVAITTFASFSLFAGAAPTRSEPSPAAASDVRFNVDGKAFVFPVPAGTCVQPSNGPLTQKLSALMTASHFELGAFTMPCVSEMSKPGGLMWAFIAYQPLQARSPLSRQELIRRVYANVLAQYKEKENSIMANTANSIGNALGNPVSISGIPAPIGFDEYGIYSKALMTEQVGAESITANTVQVQTFMHGYLFAYQWIARPGSDADSTALLTKAKIEMRRFVEANDGR
ncbi:MAG TPA: hypothetical protein VG939_18145 [Caulobacteraceae bacterium]|nr:hypothetical protein [Caulobacteraceae bacterium]